MDIKKGKTRIRNAESDDCEKLAAWWNDGAVMAHAGFPAGLGITADEIRRKIASDSDVARRRLMIEHDGIPVGEMSYSTKASDTAKIGVNICESSYRNKGLGRVILSLLIKELFSSGYKKIILDTNPKNERARHVYEKLGFLKLRVNIDSWKDQTGALQSSIDYELTPEQFIDLSGSKTDLE
ncbi:MAG: GNAT family N-acetyltransferase [Clostridia bacterium]|nr:GNAT family N-acetyltransferase [Clostridia bacterium]